MNRALTPKQRKLFVTLQKNSICPEPVDLWRFDDFEVRLCHDSKAIGSDY